MTETAPALPVVTVRRNLLGVDAWQADCDECGLLDGAPKGWGTYWITHRAASLAAAQHLDTHRRDRPGP